MEKIDFKNVGIQWLWPTSGWHWEHIKFFINRWLLKEHPTRKLEQI